MPFPFCQIGTNGLLEDPPGQDSEYPVVVTFFVEREPLITQIHYDNYGINPTIFAILEGKTG